MLNQKNLSLAVKLELIFLFSKSLLSKGQIANED